MRWFILGLLHPAAGTGSSGARFAALDGVMLVTRRRPAIGPRMPRLSHRMARDFKKTNHVFIHSPSKIGIYLKIPKTKRSPRFFPGRWSLGAVAVTRMVGPLDGTRVSPWVSTT